jgi:hypothetical protein
MKRYGGDMSKDHQPAEESRGEAAPPAVSHLRRRELQAPIAACLIREFAEAVGNEAALEIAARAIRDDARISGKAMAERLGGNSLAELGRVVREVWSEGEAVSVRLLEDTGERLSFDVTRCRYAEMYEAQDMKDLGFCLSCSRDGAFAEGFNPRIKLSRTQTIMEGAPYCDFRFTLEPEP